MPTDPFDIIKSISRRAINERFPYPVKMNTSLKPWQGLDGQVTTDSDVRYFFMDISYWETDPDTGAEDLVSE